jgi:hypothetical protein
MLSNPPFGVTWGGKDGYETEADVALVRADKFVKTGPNQ